MKELHQICVRANIPSRLTTMFVVSISNNGQERNLVANEVHLTDGRIIIQAGGQRHVFPVLGLINILAIVMPDNCRTEATCRAPYTVQ
jgi:hypothetical protein